MQTFCFIIASLAGAFWFSGFLAKGSLSYRGTWIARIFGILAIVALILGFIAPVVVLIALIFAVLAIWKAPTN